MVGVSLHFFIEVHMNKSKRKGICHICGQEGFLTFEHIPPKKAFNNRKVIILEFDEVISLGPDEIPTSGRQNQKGMGAYTLCARCNNNTGSWYANRFIEWCYQSMEILERAEGRPGLVYLNHIFPLPILKQIITMFFSVNGPEFRTTFPELEGFVLNKEKKYLPDRYRFFVYYNLSSWLRSIGITISANIKTQQITTLSEMSYPPFGYVITVDSEPPDQRLIEITHFARYDYNEFAVIYLKPPLLQINTPYPADYRTKEEVKKQYLKSIAQKKSKRRKKSD